MGLRNTTSTYGTVSKFFHWITAILIIAMVSFGWFMGDFSDDAKPFIYNTHKLIGLTIFTLILLRIIWAYVITHKPTALPTTAAWQKAAERFVHFLLYLCPIGMVLSGWIGSVAGGRPPHLGDYIFNLPIAPDKALAKTAFNLHGIFAYTLIALITIHVLAALYHHIIRRDQTLYRML
jgi:cytochrome b561